MGDALELYYQRFYPFRSFFQWLNHSPAPSNDFTNREIAFTLQNEAYLRYQSYPTSDAFKKDVLRLGPARFEVGPVYSANPRDRKALPKAAFRPIAKEVVFDIDLTDYDDVRTCCKGTSICEKCWQYITVAMQIMERALRDDFGFQHILWVYSGRRGAHAWVCDESARVLDDQQRRAVAGYLQVVGKGRQGSAVSLPRPLHPHLQRSLEILARSFEKVTLHDMDPWRTAEQAEELLQRLKPEQIREKLRARWGSSEVSSSQRWRDIDEEARQMPKGFKTEALLDAKQDIIFEYMYPRLDVEVSKHLNHLLKAPFCIHPGTGNVCVPIDADRDFDPFTVPKLDQLISELDQGIDSEQTSLKPFTDHFASFVQGVQRPKRAADSLEF